MDDIFEDMTTTTKEWEAHALELYEKGQIEQALNIWQQILQRPLETFETWVASQNSPIAEIRAEQKDDIQTPPALSLKKADNDIRQPVLQKPFFKAQSASLRLIQPWLNPPKKNQSPLLYALEAKQLKRPQLEAILAYYPMDIHAFVKLDKGVISQVQTEKTVSVYTYALYCFHKKYEKIYSDLKWNSATENHYKEQKQQDTQILLKLLEYFPQGWVNRIEGGVWHSLTYAVYYGCEDFVKALVLKHKAPLHEYDTEGNTPLITAIKAYNLGIARFLIEQGAPVSQQQCFVSPDCENTNAHTPLSLLFSLYCDKQTTRIKKISERDLIEITALLLKHGASPNQLIAIPPSKFLTLHAYLYSIPALPLTLLKNLFDNGLACNVVYAVDDHRTWLHWAMENPMKERLDLILTYLNDIPLSTFNPEHLKTFPKKKFPTQFATISEAVLSRSIVSKQRQSITYEEATALLNRPIEEWFHDICLKNPSALFLKFRKPDYSKNNLMSEIIKNPDLAAYCCQFLQQPNHYAFLTEMEYLSQWINSISLLHLATTFNCLSFIKLFKTRPLLNRNFPSPQNINMTAFQMALNINNAETMHALIDIGVDVHAANFNPLVPLLIKRFKTGLFDPNDLLLEKLHSNLNTLLKEKEEHEQANMLDFMISLYRKFQDSVIPTFKWLLNKGLSLEPLQPHNTSPLVETLKEGALEMVEALLDAGC